MVNGSRYYRAMESVSIASALSSANFTHARSESINADSLNSPTSYRSEEGSGGQPQPELFSWQKRKLELLHFVQWLRKWEL